jgi:type VI secretion system secreted protein Hcp
MPIYMNYNDLAITGDVTESGHPKWIELDSLQFGVSRGISSPIGGVNDRESTAPSVSEIQVTKVTDQASLQLVNEALQGEGKKVVIDLCKTDQGKLEVFLTYTLTNCMISGFSTSSSGDRPHESLSLNFTKIELRNVSMGADAKAGNPESLTYDLGLAAVC